MPISHTFFSGAKIAFFWLALVGGILFIGGFSIEKEYTYSGEDVTPQEIPAPSKNALSASLTGLKDKKQHIQRFASSFSGPRNMVAVRLFPTGDFQEEPRVSLLLNGTKIAAPISHDIQDTDMFLATEPVFLPAPITALEVEVDWGASIAGKIEISAVDTDAGKLTLRATTPTQANPSIIARSEWGADENLRYADTKEWQAILERNKQYKPTAAQKKATEKTKSISNWLVSNYPEEFSGSLKIGEENGHPLAWPIEKASIFDRAVVHHTGEDHRKDDGTLWDEAAVMRGIYYYHTRTRQWGDIGYNYVIGKSGKIYEGRAGGDYAVGAHTLWNNQRVVGISLMGEFSSEKPEREQISGLLELLNFLSSKYGIDFSAKQKAHRECTNWKCPTPGETVEVWGLSGHRDNGHTNCPGDNLYNMLEKIRSLENFSHGRQLVVRPGSGIAGDPLLAKLASLQEQKPETILVSASQKENTTVTTPTPSVTVSGLVSAASATFSSEASPAEKIIEHKTFPVDPNAKNVEAKKIRVKLSVPELDFLQIAPTGGRELLLSVKDKSGSAKKYLILRKKGKNEITISLGSKNVTFQSPIRLSSEIIEIQNWKRIPAWDKTGKTNDNLFRGTLEIINEKGKWKVINELPLGDYLKGLGEVSDGDHPEKIKTITTAARTYAAFYLLPENRKFPGQNYDASDDPNVFQKYLGYGLEKRSPNINTILKETKNTVILFEGKLIKPWYFNASTGKTRSAKEYCEARGGKNCPDIPFLQSVVDPGEPAKAYNGHGVGISGNGATALAKSGKTFSEILSYFLTGVQVEQLQ